jgi:hypothetical protein
LGQKFIGSSCPTRYLYDEFWPIEEAPTIFQSGKEEIQFLENISGYIEDLEATW